MSLRTLYIDVYLYMNVGMYGCIIVGLYVYVCVCVCVCVCVLYMSILYIYIYIYVYVCLYIPTHIYSNAIIITLLQIYICMFVCMYAYVCPSNADTYLCIYLHV